MTAVRRLAALLLPLVALTVAAAPASAAPKQVPCTASSGGKFDCQWYRSGDGQSGGSIVVANGQRVGFLHKGTNWILCQQSGAAVHSPEGYENTWYGWTQADNGQWGWASALDASGGDNYGSFSSAPNCNGSHGAPPSVSGLWGSAPPVGTPKAPTTAPAPAPGQPAPAPAPDAPEYTAALASGFAPIGGLDARHIWNVGAVTGDDGLVVMRFFIPNENAAGSSLFGDDRGFDAAPNLSDRSRAWMVWNTATGDVSLTVAPSTIGPLARLLPGGAQLIEGRRISALQLKAKGRAEDVTGTEDTGIRFSNDAFVERTSNNGLRLRMSLLNSLTNKIPLAAWSVDVDARIDPINDTTRGAFERYASTRSKARMAKSRTLTRKQRSRSRTTLRCLSGKLKGKQCASVTAALKKAAKGSQPPVGAAARSAAAPRAASLRQAPAGGGAGGYAISLLGNGYPAVEAYYYPRKVSGTNTLFRRRVDPDKLNSTVARAVDGGGGTGALDRYSWFDCRSSANGGSTCRNALPGEDNRNLPFNIAGIGPRIFSRVSPQSYNTNPTDDAQDRRGT